MREGVGVGKGWKEREEEREEGREGGLKKVHGFHYSMQTLSDHMYIFLLYK